MTQETRHTAGADGLAAAGRPSLLAALGPGILVAATGIGAGDLATAAFTGSRLGVAVLWAVVIGAGFKFAVNEGLARFQLVTGKTLLEGVIGSRWGKLWLALFGPYLFLWSFFVGAALMSACGVTIHAITAALGVGFADASAGKLWFGIASSAIGLGVVWLGGFAVFERLMAACVGVMFVIVLVTAGMLWPGTEAVLSGLFVPSIPDAAGHGIDWTAALIGGVGGTLTVLCYGYWIREKGRTEPSALGVCRLDLGVGYALTGFFGLAMVIIGSTVDIDGRGAGLVVALSERLAQPLGAVGQWLFLVGAFGAVFSSLLGVWQAVPYLFADLVYTAQAGGARSGRRPEVLTQSRPYRAYLVAIALVPMLGLGGSFAQIQKLYAIIGAAFLPVLALGLLVLNGRRATLGRHRNGVLAVLVLAATLGFFSWLAADKWWPW